MHLGRPVSPEAKERQKAYIDKYQKENIRRVTIKLNRQIERDSEIMEHLDTKTNIQGYVKELIYRDMGK